MRKQIALSVFSILFVFNSDAQTNKLAKFTSTTMPTGLTQSTLFDNGTNVGVGITNPQARLDVLDNIRVSGSSPSMGYLSFWRGNTVYTGYIEWLRPSGLRTAYMGFDNDNNLGIHLENSANFTVTGGKVGINTLTPSAMLNVTNGSVLFDGTTGTTPVSGAGTRMMWIPAKAAFRVGAVTGTQWDDANVGANSFATGFNTKASGPYSTAFGIGTLASGHTSTAFGSYATASGLYSIAIGSLAIASGYNSTAFGANTTASGDYSTVFGVQTTASGDYSTAFGSFTTAQPSNCFVIGRYNYNPGTYSPTTWVETDMLFAIGNGTSSVATSNAVTVLKNGNCGIGVVAPATKLDVNGTAKISGNVGIGTAPDASATNYKLSVCGTIHSKEVIIETNNWCDYVFDKNYRRMTWQEKLAYINTNKHLPSIASGKEIETNGLKAGATMQGMMQNIEENTLDVIDLYKIIQKQSEEITLLKNEMEQLKKKK